MMKLFGITSAVLLAGCSLSVANYKELGNGKYNINAQGNIYTDRSELRAKIESKAASICGEGKYKFEDDGKFEISKTKVYMNGSMQDIPGHRLTIITSCTDS